VVVDEAVLAPPGAITPVLHQLHWLPVRQRIDFKLAILAYNTLHGQLSQYLGDDCQLMTDVGRRTLRSAHSLTYWAENTPPLGNMSFSAADFVVELPYCGAMERQHQSATC